MNKVKKNLDNQVIGLLPLVLFMFLDNYFSYLLSFFIAFGGEERVSVHVLAHHPDVRALCLLFLFPVAHDTVCPFAVDHRGAFSCLVGPVQFQQAHRVALCASFRQSDL